MRVAIFALSMALSGCLLQPTEDPSCAGALTCGSCLEQGGCGWCGDTGRCVAGSSFGPDTADCVASSWRYTGCAAPPGAVGSCGVKLDCNGCLFDVGDEPDCTWCAGRGECIPRGETCASGTAVRDYDACGEADCQVWTTCDQCRAADCDWCDMNGGSCVRSALECDAHYRYWSSSASCPPPNDCDSHLGCSACIADPLCGWCDSPGSFGHCVASSGGDDYADWCSGSDFYDSFCPGG